jgi:type II secretory pathway pseudopilin PulG
MAGRHLRQPQHGAALLIFMILMVMGAMTYLVNSLTPEMIEARRAQKTHAALVQAREALIGYALRYRDTQAAKDLDSTGDDDRAMYGYLPLPDLGSSRNQNVDPNCKDASNNPLEGCDANTFTGVVFDANKIGPTVVGRFPWRTLGTEPLRDGHGECLWMIVSSLHSRIQGVNPVLPPMNWDTLGQLDVVVANGTSALVSALTSPHNRPVAVIFAPGPPLPGQNRSNLGGNDVSQCGGNYNVANYLDPTAAIGGITNYLAGTNAASGATGDSDPTNDPDTPKGLLTQGKVFVSGSNYLPSACQGSTCTQAANDIGLTITSDMLFGAIRKSANFRTDINTMLDRMVNCLRDQTIAGGTAARISDNGCYDGNQHPLGYYDHYKELVFLAKPAAPFTVNGDTTCAGALIFAGQRSGTQGRVGAEKNDLSNYLEAPNFPLTSTTFTGLTLFDRVSSTQVAHQDIVRCIPNSASFNEVPSSSLPSDKQLTSYDPTTRTLTLGKEGVSTDDYPAASLFGCSWVSEAHTVGNGFRAYFNFTILNSGNGFTFAMIDGDRNTGAVCGAAAEQLGYSGDNGDTDSLAYPKIGIEIDTSRQTSAYSSGGSGRSDPNYLGGHLAIVYWGQESIPDDDNVHGRADTSARPAPSNPPVPAVVTQDGAGVARLDSGSVSGLIGIKIHVRVEVTLVSTNSTQQSKTFLIETWLERRADQADVIAAMKNTTRSIASLYPNINTASFIHLRDQPTIFNTAGAACSVSTPCATGYACETDNICYMEYLKSIRLGFTGSQGTAAKDQVINIQDFVSTWLP